MTNEARMLRGVKATRGRVRTPKALAKQNTRSRISHEVLWSAMRPRIAFRHLKQGTRVVLLALLIAPVSIFGAAKNRPLPQLPGYKAVRVHYGPLNKMIMSVRINGQPANLLVDTGSNEIILDRNAAESFGVRPSQQGPRYIGFTEISGHLLPVAFVQSLTAGDMSLGSSPAVVRSSSLSGTGNAHVDGILGLQTLFRHKA